MVQFIKGPWKSGEDFLAKGLEPRFKLVKMGKGFVGIMGDTLPREEHEEAAEKALEYAREEVNSGNWDMLILDEVHNAIHLNLISKAKVLEFVNFAEPKLELLLLTGRDAPR